MARVIIRCDPGDYAAFEPRVRDWDRVLRRELHEKLERAAELTASLARHNARSLRLAADPPSRRPEGRSTGLRAAIAASVTVTGRETGRGAEFRIQTSHEMSSTTNADRFRHPVFGRRERGQDWAQQESQPWWTRAVDQSSPRANRWASYALDDAVREIE